MKPLLAGLAIVSGLPFLLTAQTSEFCLGGAVAVQLEASVVRTSPNELFVSATSTKSGPYASLWQQVVFVEVYLNDIFVTGDAMGEDIDPDTGVYSTAGVLTLSMPFRPTQLGFGDYRAVAKTFVWSPGPCVEQPYPPDLRDQDNPVEVTSSLTVAAPALNLTATPSSYIPMANGAGSIPGYPVNGTAPSSPNPTYTHVHGFSFRFRRGRLGGNHPVQTVGDFRHNFEYHSKPRLFDERLLQSHVRRGIG